MGLFPKVQEEAKTEVLIWASVHPRDVFDKRAIEKIDRVS